MKIFVLRVFFLLAIINLGETLTLDLTLRNFLFDTNGSFIQKTITELFEKHDDYLGFLLRLVSSDYFDLKKFLPSEVTIIKPLLRSLERQKCPQEIQERFYNFTELETSEEGRNFLISLDVNFAKSNWRPRIFTVEQRKEILLKIQKLPQSKIEYLSPCTLEQPPFSHHPDEQVNLDLFGIASFIVEDLSEPVLVSWLKSYALKAQHDDLLFYRLAFLSWKYQCDRPKFIDLSAPLLEELCSVEGPFKEFRKAVWKQFFQYNDTDEDLLFESLDTVLKDNPSSQAILYFEHALASAEMGYRVTIDKISKLFQQFPPSLISPFLCRSLLTRYHHYYFSNKQFVSILSEALPAWSELYWKSSLGSSYFPTSLQPAHIQLNLWRRSNLFIEDLPTKSIPALYLNHPWRWTKYIGAEYFRLQKEIIKETDGFTFIDCLAEQESITAFIEGRIVELMLNGVSLPKFPYFLLQNNTKNQYKANLPDGLCIINEEKQPKLEDVKRSLTAILASFRTWRVPSALYNTL